MNRLILVGNGFDLAHGLKTSYKDFIIGYLADCFSKVNPWRFDYNDELLSVNISHPINFKDFIRKCLEDKPTSFLLEKKEIINFFEICYNNSCLWDLFNLDNLVHFDTANENTDKHKFYLHISSILSIKVKSHLLEKIVSSCKDCNWVDIENEYFDALKKCKNEDGLFDFEKVKQLNKELKFLKEKLEEYLIIEQKNSKIKINEKLVELINAKFKLSDFEPAFKGVRLYELNQMLGVNGVKKVNATSLLVLNFNYTNTFNNYLKSIQPDYGDVQINHIHGELGENNNPIIFGFGDEHDKDYLTFEEQVNNELFTHIKSYQYFNTPNYRNLVRFLNSDNFQVYIMGHSCGLSDRTMFKEIFDHENCKSVKIFHHRWNNVMDDYWEKTVNLGRHFSNKGRMRKLIVEFNVANEFPQN